MRRRASSTSRASLVVLLDTLFPVAEVGSFQQRRTLLIKCGSGKHNIEASSCTSVTSSDMCWFCRPEHGSLHSFGLSFETLVGRGQSYWEDEKITEEIPACRQMFNVFHPFDPVAYRLEPLICKEFMNRRPVIIPYHRGGKRLHIGFQEFSEELAMHSQLVRNQLNSLRVNIINIFQSRNRDKNGGTAHDVQEEERSYGSIMMDRLTGSKDGRVDHTLQDQTFRHPYLSALRSHTNYWRDKDTALFILNHLYRDIPEDAPTVEETTDGTGTGSRAAATKLFYDRDIMDEETPLTFSDSCTIREFSRKAKKVLSAR